MARPATFLLTVSKNQLDVIRDALVLASAAGRGSFTECQKWWGNEAGHGCMLKGNLEALTFKMTKLHARRIPDSPEPARVAWDIAAVIWSTQASLRLKRAKTARYLARHSTEPAARVDVLVPETTMLQGPLSALEALPASASEILPALQPRRGAKKLKPVKKLKTKKGIA